MKAISIIIPIYNTEKYLEQCISSAINQTIKDIEIICVNDGSTDSSLTIINKFASIDNRVTVISQSNKGLSSARNEGLKKASGDYVVFLDSDDWYIDNLALEKLYSVAKKENLEIVYFEAETFFEDGFSGKGTIEQKFVNRYKNAVNYGNAKSGQELFCEFKRNKNYRPNVYLQIYDRLFLERNNITFFDGIIHEDELFTMQCLTLAKRVKCVDMLAYGRRYRANSIMTSKSNSLSSCLGYLNVYKQLIAFGEKNISCFSGEYLEEYCKSLSHFKSICASKFCDANQELDSTKKINIDKKDKLLLLHFKQEYDTLKKAKERKKRIEKSLEYRIGVKIFAIPRAVQRKIRNKIEQKDEAK